MDAEFIPRLKVMDSNSRSSSIVITSRKSSLKMETVDMQTRYLYKVDGHKPYNQRIDTKDL